jgi:hypothetical protein
MARPGTGYIPADPHERPLHTYALIDSIHTHILVQFSRGILLTLVLLTASLFLKSLDILQALLQFWRSQICER